MSTDSRQDLKDPTFQAYALLRSVFTIAPILFGLDKFFNVLTDWPQYLAGWLAVVGSASSSARRNSAS